MQRKLLSFIFLWAWSYMGVIAQNKVLQPQEPTKAGQAGTISADKITTEQAKQWLKDLPSGFIVNKGQLVDQQGALNKGVKYLLNMPGLKVQLRQTGFSYDTYVLGAAKGEKNVGASLNAHGDQNPTPKIHRVDIELEGANDKAKLVAEIPSGGVNNMVTQHGEFAGIQQFGKVTYKDIYPGIDLEFLSKKGTEKPIEYNFIVHPGADASLIKLKYNGPNAVLLKNGRIVMKLAHGILSENIPASFLQPTNKNIEVTYRALERNLFAFNLPDYDRTKTLVIDPTPNLEWATYYGDSGEEQIRGVATDAQGNVYVTGFSNSTNNIASSGAYQSSIAGDDDIFIAKFNSAGQRLWGTYFGGSESDQAFGITVHNGQIYIAGHSKSVGLATSGAHQVTGYSGQTVAILARFDGNTGQRNWTTYYGGYPLLHAGFFKAIKIDNNDNIFALGASELNLYPLTACHDGDIATPGTFRTTGGCGTSFLVKFNSAGVRQWGTYLVGSEDKIVSQKYGEGLNLEVDAAGDVYVAGSGGRVSVDENFAANVGEGTAVQKGYIGKFSGNNGTRLWGRFFDGSITGLALDASNQRLHVVGSTTGTTGIASAGAYHSSLSSTQDAFWASFDLTGHYTKGTYLGGLSGSTHAIDCKLDGAGHLIILGISNTTGSELATNCSYQPTPAGNIDLFLNKFSISTGERIWGTYYGGVGDDAILEGPWFGNLKGSENLALDDSGGILIGSSVAAASDKLATTSSHQPTHAGGTTDAVIAKFNSGVLPADFAVTASTLSPITQNACILGIPGIITGNAVGVATPLGYNAKLFYQWQKSANAAGPWEDMPGEVYKDLQPLPSQTTNYYRRLVKVNTDYCNQVVVATSDSVSVVINSSVAPIANADGPQWYVCGTGSNTVTLNGSAAGGTAAYTYRWYEGSTSTGSVLANAAAWTTPAVTEATTYTLQVTDATGCVDIDQITVVPAVANAGSDQSICQGAGGVQIGSAPVASPLVTYNWAVISGSTNSLSCTTCAQPIANPATVTTYRLTVTVQRKDGSTCTSTDDVIVAPVAAPNNTLTFAGTDKTICKNTSVTLGGTADGSFNYTWTSGQYLSAAQVANPVFNAGTAAVNEGAINYTVSAEKNGCVFTDEVKVAVLNSRISDQDETVCGPAFSSHLDEDNAPGTVYTWSIVSGNGVVLHTENEGKSAYLKSNSGITRFRRTVSLNGVSCSADILVEPCGSGGDICDFEIETLSQQGCPIVTGDAVLRLGTSIGNSSDYNFKWSPANLVDNTTSSTVTITSTTQATITVVITNKYDASITCTESIVINPPGWSLPIFTAEDKYTCPSTPVQIGSTPLSGFTYAWTPSLGLSNVNTANPIASVTGTSEFYVTISETATGCVNQDTVTVNISNPVADAGNDRAVCNGATVTLGSPAPAGTSWVYSWSPSNAAWTNGTNASSAQPQLQFASASPQTFTLTVTDPLSGCSATDQVVLSNTVLSGEYAGAEVTTCQGSPVQLGREAEPFAQYAWFMANGTTPATGLSSNTVANPTVLNPATTTTYVVQVSYPGCSTPLSDQVTLTVNPVTGLDLIDKVLCPVGPINIGYGATGNPSAPSGATYLWSPATGLSSTTAANPTATVTSETTYSVTVTLASGCIFTDQVKVTPTANAGADAILCPGESTSLGVTAIAGASYSWSVLSGTAGSIVSGANTAQPTVKPTATTTYRVSVTLNGCTTTDDVIVTVNTPTSFTISGNTTICEGGTTTLSLDGTPAANTTWQWSPLDGVSSPNSTNTTIVPTATQTYRLTQTNLSTGCSNYKEVVMVVNPNNITATVGDIDVCAASPSVLPFNVTSSGTNYSYVWSPSVGLSNAFVANPTVTTASPRTYSVTVTDNTSKCQLVETLNVGINPTEACYPDVTLTGNVFHDANALKDVTVNSTSPMAIPTDLYVTLVDASGNPVKTVEVASNGTYDFGVTSAGNYSVVLNQNPAGSTVPSLPSGWINTGENLGAGVGNDASINGILTGITVAGTNVTNANFGVQQPPVTTGGQEPPQPNPGGTTTVDLTTYFGMNDPDGVVESITFTQFPVNVTTVTINGTTYVATGTTPGAGQSVWPSGNLTVQATNLSVLIDPVDGDVSTSIPFFVTDNGGLESNVSTVTADFTIPTVNLSGNVFHDANALSDGTVNSTATTPALPTGLYVSLVDANGDVVETVAVAANGSYDFGATVPGTYSVVLHQTVAGSTTPALPSGWINTGENLGAAAGDDASVNGILPTIVVTTTDVTNANFGVQTPPVTTDEAIASQPNPGGIVTVDLSSEFDFSDADGTVETVTFTEFPENVTTVSINGTTYVAPGETPGAGQTVFPASGVTTPVTALEVLVDPVDGDVTVSVPFLVTDNGGAESNESTVTAPFTTPMVNLSGNVFHDANALSDGTVNSTATTPALPTGLYVSLVDANGDVVETVAVAANGSYDFGATVPGTYSVVLHQTVAGSTTPALPSGWINTGENLGAAAGDDASVNGILSTIVVTTTDVTNANFGVQQPPVADPKTYLIDQPFSGSTIKLDGSLVSTGTGTSSPGQFTGTDNEDGTLDGANKNKTVVITTLPVNGILYYNDLPVTAGQVIPNYDPTLTSIQLTGTEYTSVTFEYAYQDEGGAESPPAPYTITWDSPLPVTLISFTARIQEQNTVLNWKTAAETNSDAFEIQRSSDGKAWSMIGTVKALGESVVIKEYKYKDQQPIAGSNLYRLKMIDLDGTFAYSRIVDVNLEARFETSIYPNPVNDVLTLKVSDWEKVKSVDIQNLSGIQVYESSSLKSGTIDLKFLPEGMYILRIINTDGSVYTHKLVHLK